MLFKVVTVKVISLAYPGPSNIPKGTVLEVYGYGGLEGCKFLVWNEQLLNTFFWVYVSDCKPA
jgi:hypothetical protein